MKSLWRKVFCPRCRYAGVITTPVPNGLDKTNVCPLCLGSGNVERAKKDEWEQGSVAQHIFDHDDN